MSTFQDGHHPLLAPAQEAGTLKRDFEIDCRKLRFSYVCDGFSAHASGDKILATMMATETRQLTTLRAACAVLALLLGWLSLPVALAAGSSDGCSMACRIKQTHCCCKSQRAFIKSRAPDDRERIVNVQASSRCPEGCVPAQFSSSGFSRDAHAKVDYRVDPSTSFRFKSNRIVLARDSLLLEPSSPRAPPAYRFSLI